MRSGLLPPLAFVQRDEALSAVGVYVVRHERCERCGSRIWLIETDVLHWIDVVVGVVGLGWVDHDRGRCDRARARRRAGDLIKHGSVSSGEVSR